MSIGDIWEEMKSQERNYCFWGVTPAVVTNIEDPDKLGRVKVKLLNRDTSEHETEFIRVMTMMAGKEWGCFFLPEVGDEVLVAFSSGEVARPYVLGALWNQDNKVPRVIEDQKNEDRLIKTKSGHEILFHDESGKDYVQISTPKKLVIRLDDETESITVKDDGAKSSVTISMKDGTVTVTGAKKVDLAAGGAKISLDGEANSVTLESSSSIKLKSQQINIEAGSMMTIKSGGDLTLSATGPANLKGAIVKVN